MGVLAESNLSTPRGSTEESLLEDLWTLLGTYVAYPSPSAKAAHALWIVHAHAVKAFESSPRLAFLSPEPGSGKTRALEITELLVPEPLFTSNVTVAVLARSIHSTGATVLLDEADAIFGPRAKDNEDIRAILNSGHRRGGSYLRMVGDGANMQPQRFSSYAAVAIAGLGDLPETVMQRSIVVRMRRRSPGEVVHPFRRRKVAPVAEPLNSRLATWATQYEQALSVAEPEMPQGVADRSADVWEPLLAIADIFGGPWPERARAACTDLLSTGRGASASMGVQLLTDVRLIFANRDKMATEQLVRELCSLDDSPWGDLRGTPLDARSLARLFVPYGIHPKVLRVGADTPRGYERRDLVDAWDRYVPAASGTDATSATPTAIVRT